MAPSDDISFTASSEQSLRPSKLRSSIARLLSKQPHRANAGDGASERALQGSLSNLPPQEALPLSMLDLVRDTPGQLHQAAQHRSVLLHASPSRDSKMCSYSYSVTRITEIKLAHVSTKYTQHRIERAPAKGRRAEVGIFRIAPDRASAALTRNQK